MKKVLFVAHVVKRHFMLFHVPYIKWFKNNGYETHVCANNDYENKNDCKIPHCDKYYDLPFQRSPFSSKNIATYKELKKIINQNQYDIIHCHTPVGGVLTRIAARNARKKGTKVIYTAHGFHFYKGAPIVNWILYYPIEKWLSRYTDILITINNEDFERAKRKFKTKKVEYIQGVGIDLNKFKPQLIEKKKELRKKYGYSDTDFILIYVAEMSYRKHQDLLINVVNILKTKIPVLKLLLVGTGELLDKYIVQAKRLKLEQHINFLGYRNDIPNLVSIADVSVSSSRQEGLPVNVMEAMATGLPLVVTNCRGNRDLVKDGENGYVVEIDDVYGFAKAVEKLYNSEELRKSFSKKSLEIIKEYSLDKVREDMSKIYNNMIKTQKAVKKFK